MRISIDWRILNVALGIILLVSGVSGASPDTISLKEGAVGDLCSFGWNAYGQLGLGDTTNRLIPTEITTLPTAKSITAGRDYSLVLLENGDVYAFGANYYGQLGLGDTDDRLSPEKIAFFSNVYAIAAADRHSLVLLENGDVYSFGHNYHGQLGMGDTADRFVPTKIASLSDVVAISSGSGSHSFVLLENGDLYGFGDNACGGLGLGDTTDRWIPTKITGLSGVTAMSAGWSHSLVLLENGDVYSFGSNFSGELGQGDTTHRWIPTRIASMSDVKAISAGNGFSLVMLENGDVYAFGSNSSGQLGLGDTTNRLIPTKITALSGVVQSIAAGGYYSLVLLDSGDVYGFGSNFAGQLGLGDTTDRTVPTKIPTVAGVQTITAGTYQSMVILGTPPVAVNIPDPGLEEAIRGAIGKPSGTIYEADLIGLTILDASNRSISNLDGIQYCTDLVWLDLTDNQIADISALSDLALLIYLYMSNNQIVNIGALSGLTNVAHLRLYNNQIVDISALSSLTYLTELALMVNRIVDISALSDLTNLSMLLLGNNQIVDIAPLVSNTGIGTGDFLDIQWNHLCLTPGTGDMDDINTLLGRGVNPLYSTPQIVCAETSAVFKVDEEGNVLADQTYHGAAFESGAADVAEWVHVAAPVEPGDVVELDPMAPERYRIAQNPFSSLVAGVISTTPGLTLGTDLDASEKALLALVGIVPVKVTSEGGPIQPGDLLVTSSTPGHAMLWAGPGPCLCSLIGKALEPMDEEQGTILVLLTAH